MVLDIEEKTTEYYIVAVEPDEYSWREMFSSPPTPPEPWASIDQWCEQVFGEHGIWGGPAGSWKRMGPKYFFQTDEERMMFILRWS